MAEDVYTRLLTHLGADPATTPLDTRLFDEAELVLPTYLTGTDNALLEKRHSLMRILAADLTDTRRPDHTPIVNLLIKLFEPFSWSQIVDFGTQSVPFKDGLAVGEGDWMVPFNRLMLALLEKATGSAADAGQVAGMLETMLALVRLWLRTGDVGVAGRCAGLIFELLRVDLPGMASQHGRSGGGGRGVGAQGLVWKRVFGDRDVYNTFFESTSLTKGLEALSKNQKTIAQARLMEWLPRVAALNWEAVSRSHLREVEERYGARSLLDYAALQMVDYKDDVLMHRCLIDFYSDLLRATASSNTHTMPQHDSIGLQYLIMNGLHVRTAEIFLQTRPIDPVDSMFLYGSAANYLATYAEEYKKHFLASDTASQVRRRLMQTLDLTPGKWAHSDSPKHDLHVLASLPRAALLPFTSSPLALLPSRSPNADVLNTLAVVFHGPPRDIIYPPPPPSTTSQPTQQHQDLEEASAARALYFNYLARNPRFWQDITTHADTLALKHLALAALNLLTSVITANWSSHPSSSSSSSSSYDLPTTTIATPETGHLAILSPPALEYVLPYLLQPPITYSNLVGGRGDSEATAYKVATAKFDALRALRDELQAQLEREPDEGFEEILATLRKRLGQGVVPRGAEVGGAVGTLEL